MATHRKRRAQKRSFELDPRYIIAGSLVLIAVLLVLIYATRDTSSAETGTSPDVNAALDAAPPSVSDAPGDGDTVRSGGAMPGDFSLPGLQGGEVALSAYRDDYVLVNFWATWCPPCKAEMPDLHNYYVTHKDQGFTMIAVNVGEDAVTVKDFIDERGFTFPVALDVQSMVFGQYGLQSLPTSILIAPGGEIVGAWTGMISSRTLDQQLTPMLES